MSLCPIGDSEDILLQDVSAFAGVACGGGFPGLFAAVHLPVGPVLHGQNIFSRKGSRPKGHQGQKAYGLAPLLQLVHKLLRTRLLPVGVFQQDAELVAANAVTVTAAGVGFFDAVADLGQTDIPLCVAVAVVDLLEVVHIEHHQHPVAAAHLCGTVQVAVLIQQSGEGVQLIPHLAAVDEIQHRQQGNAQPCDVEIRQCHLNDRLEGQKDHQGVDQCPAAVLKLPRRDDGGGRKIHDGRKVHEDVNIKVLPAGIEVVGTDGEHQPGGDGQGKEQQIARLAAHRRLEPAVRPLFPIHAVHEAKGYRRGEAEPQIVGQDVQPAVPRRSTVYRQRHHLQHRDRRDQRKGEEKPLFLLFVQGFAELCEEAHEAQHKKVNGC